MDIQKILSATDHTLLNVCATFEDIKRLCDEAIRYGTASVCIPPCYVKAAKDYVGDAMKVCTVIGFPNGYHSTGVKAYETECALADGADEIDMVINVGAVKAGEWDYLRDEIATLKRLCGERILKVIIETCLLEEDEKIRMCHLVSEAGADFIKTSTGFSHAGAKPEDIRLFAEHIAPGVRIKAAGGIRTLEDAEHFLSLGASRLGTSSIVKLIRNEQAEQY